MNKSAFIRDLDSLKQLKIAILQFCEENESQILAIDSRLETKMSALKSNEFRLLNSIQTAEDDLQKAKYSLSICKSNIYKDEDGRTVYPNCEYEENELIECGHKLKKANSNYDTFKRSIRLLEEKIEYYQRSRYSYKSIITFKKEKATSCLGQLINGAEDYLSCLLYTSDAADE